MIEILLIVFGIFILVPASIAMWACAIIVSMDAWRRITGKESNAAGQPTRDGATQEPTPAHVAGSAAIAADVYRSIIALLPNATADTPPSGGRVRPLVGRQSEDA